MHCRSSCTSSPAARRPESPRGRDRLFHYDPCAQLLSKIVRGFRKDLLDAERFLRSGMVDADRFRELVHEIPGSAYAQYPNLSRDSVVAAVDEVLASFE